MTTAPLPVLLREIADVFGVEVALRLAERLGGTYQLLHARAAPGHPIADAVGVDVLAWMIGEYGKHSRIVIPMAAAMRRARRREEVATLVARGWSVTRIAGHLRMHVREVHRIKATLAEMARERDQGRLFG